MATTVDAKLLKSTKFPAEFNQKVDMQKVNLEVMKKWIAGKISDILGNEDDVVIELCFNLIEGSRYPDIKKLQIQLTGFLEKDTASFCQELWKLCLSAQSNPQGVPKELLEAKKLELIQEKIEAEKAADEARQRRDRDQRRDREMDAIRNRDRAERGRGRGHREARGDSWRGGRGDRDARNDHAYDRGGRDFDRRNTRRTRSPSPRRRDSRDRRGYARDSYIPGARDSRRRNDERRRSPSVSPSRSRSVSRSPSPSRRRRSFTNSRSPPRQRRRSPSRSRSSSRHRNSRDHRPGGTRGRDRISYRDGHRDSKSSQERSPSPARDRRKRRRSISSSPSPSPPPRSTKRVHRHTADSRSRSPSASRSYSKSPHERGSARSSAKASLSPDVDIVRNSVNTRKSRDRVERRLTRSNSRDHQDSPPRRQRSPSRSRSRSYGRKDRKRHRSMDRYAPAGRRRNTSSVSSPNETRDTRADTPEDEGSRRDDRARISAKDEDDEISRSAEPQEVKPPQQQANELREKLLREKIKKMRTSSTSAVNAQTNST